MRSRHASRWRIAPGRATRTGLASLVQLAIVASTLGSAFFAPASVLAGTTASAITLTTSAATVTKGTSVTFTATASPTTATGTVAILDGATQIGSCVLSKGKCTLATSGLAVGAHAVVASYPGDVTYAPATSAAVLQTVNPAFRAAAATATTTTAGATSVTLAAPTGVAVGDLLVATVSAVTAAGGATQPTITAPSGWTLVNTELTVGAMRQGVYWRVRGSADPAYTFTFSATSRAAGAIAAINGGAASAPYAIGRVNSTASTALATSALTLPASSLGIALIMGGTAVSTKFSAVTTGYTGSAAVAAAGGAAGTTVTALSAYSAPQTVASLAAATITAANAGVNIAQLIFVPSVAPVTATRITSSVAAPTYGQALSLTARVDSASASGSVAFSDGTTPLGSCVLSGGTCSIPATGLIAGSHSLTARYLGSGGFAPSASAPLLMTVAKAASTTRLSSSATSATVGQLITLSASVTTGDGGTATGPISFSDGTTGIGQCTPTGGACTFPVSTLKLGTHSLTARYDSDPNRTASVSTAVTVTIGAPVATVAVRTSPNPSVFGQPVDVTISVSTGDGTIPTGTATALDNGVPLGICSLFGTSCVVPATSLGAGSHSITGQWDGGASGVAVTSTAVTQTVAKTGSSIALTAPTSSTYGQPLVFSAAVGTSDGTTASGTVTFSDGTILLASCTLLGGTCSSPAISTLSAGAHQISARYLGDANHTASTSTATSLVVAVAPTSVALAAAPLSSRYGQSVTLSATISAGSGGTPTGTVSFSDGSTLIGSCSTTTGTCAISTAALSVGTHTINIGYSGDANRGPSATSGTYVVAKTGSTTTVSSSAAAGSVFGQSVTFTFTVAASDGSAATGSVAITDNGTSVPATCTLTGSGVCTWTTAALGAGAHAIGGAYSGDANRIGSTGSFTQNVARTGSSTTLSVSPTTSVFGGTITLGATVATTDGTAVSGTVAFLDGPTQIATCEIVARFNCSTTIATLAVGSHSLTARFGGDANRNASTSAATTATVTKSSSTTRLGADRTTMTYGQTTTLTASVTTGDGGTPSGLVSFYDGATFLASCSLDASGACSTSPLQLGLGSHSLTATFGGDASRTSSTSSALLLAVAIAPTTSTLTASPSPSRYGSRVTLSATVTSSGGNPTGTVTFRDGATTIGSCTLGATGSCSISTGDLPVGIRTLTALYGGDTFRAASTSDPLLHTVLQALSSTTVTTSPNPSVHGGSVTIRASVSTGDGGTAAGTVAFTANGTALGNCASLSAGACSITTTTLPAGTNTIEAAYSGDGLRLASTGTVVQVVAKANSTTSLAAGTVTPYLGQSVTFTVAVIGLDGLVPTGSVALLEGGTQLGSCSLTTGGRCSIATGALTLGAHQLVAAYEGDADRNGSTSSAVTVTVSQAVSTIVLTTSPNPSRYFETVTLAASVTASFGVPSGTVTFRDGDAGIDSCILQAGACSISTRALGLGGHDLVAFYSGDTLTVGSTSATVVQAVGKALSSTTLTTNPNPSVHGESVALRASIATGDGGTPAGTVSFATGGSSLGTCTPDGGACSISVASLDAGDRLIVASWSGDSLRIGSDGTATQTVLRAPTNVTLTASQASLTYGDSVSFTASLTSSDGDQSGSITIRDGGSALFTCTLVGGTCSGTTTSVAAGSRMISASFAGDANRLGASASLPLEVAQASSTTSLVTSSNPSVFGQPVDFAIAVAAADGGAVTGSVELSEGSASVGTCVLFGGTCTVTTSSLSATSHSLVARWSGDANRTGSASATLVQVMTKASPAMTLSTSATSIASGTSLTISVAFDSTRPTGSVAISDGTTGIATCVLSAGSCSGSVTSLSVGNHTLSASYLGDANNGPASSNSAVVTVGKATPSVVVTTSPSPSRLNNAVTVSTTVTGGFGLATGAVAFSDGTTGIGTCSLSSGGCSITVAANALALGDHSITARYAGDANRLAAVSAPVTHTVLKVLTSVAITSQSGSIGFGMQTRLTATVSSSDGTNLAGVISFSEGSVALGTCSTTSSKNNCSLAISGLSVGIHLITATYPGDATHLPSTSPAFTQTVTKGTTTTTVSASANPAVYATPLTLTATVTPAVSGAPSGTVTFADNGTPIGSCALAANTCSIPATGIAIGSHSITASYPGDGSFEPSTSVVYTLTITRSTSSTRIVSSAPTSVVGVPVTFAITVSTGDGLLATGVVSISDGTTGIGACTLDGAASCTVTTSGLSIGSHAIWATYEGDAGHQASSVSATQVVIRTGSTTLLGLGATTLTYGETTSLAATVSTSDGSVASGTVSFLDGTTGIGSCTLDASGACATISPVLGAGTRSISARFEGDALHVASVSAPTTITVAKSVTTTTFTVTPIWGVTYGEPVTLAAAVTTGDGGYPASAIRFLDGSTEIATCLPVLGACSVTTRSLAVGTHSLSAEYVGSANRIASASGTFSLPVSPASTATTVTVLPSPAAYGTSALITVSISTGDGGAPTGLVSIAAAGATLGSCAPNAAGVCSVGSGVLGIGSHLITATYGGDPNRVDSSSSVAHEVVRTPTTTIVATSQAVSALGLEVTFTATVATGYGVATGSVELFADGSSLGVCALGAIPTCSLATSSLASGTHTITAAYAGDETHAASTSSALEQVVKGAISATALTVDTTSAQYGSTVTATATVTGGADVATGSVELFDGSVSLGVCALDASAVCSFSLGSLAVGSHPLTAVYGGDVTHLGSTSAAVTVALTKATSATSVHSSLSPSTYGTTVRFTAIVASVGGVPTGAVEILDGASSLGTCQLAGGTCYLERSSLAAGTHEITASYAGDANRTGSTSSATIQVVERVATATGVTASPSSSAYASIARFTATVDATSATGSVSFRDGDAEIGTCSLTSGGACSLSTATLAIGTHSITAAYAGDLNRGPSTSSALTFVVSKATSATTLAVAPTTVTFGSPVSLSGSVTTGDGAAPTGSITFFAGATPVATCSITTGTGCAISTASLAAGTYSITAAYGGDATRSGSTSAAIALTVNRNASTTTIVASPSPAAFGQPVTLTATVASSDGVPFSGTVAFSDGTTGIGTCVLANAFSCSTTVSSLAVGSHSLTGSFTGGPNRNASTSSALALTITQATSTTTAWTSAAPLYYAADVTLSASVTSGDGGIPTGTITFAESKTIGTCTLGATGACSIVVATLATGAHTITATYGGDANRATSTGTISLTIVQAATATTVTSSANPVTYGSAFNLVVTVTPAAGAGGKATIYDGATSLGQCSLNGGTCTFAAPTTLAVGDHTITASNPGNANYAASTSAAITQTVNAIATTTTLTSSSNPAVWGTSVTFTASLGGGGVTGTVSFSDGTTGIGTCTISGGSCTLATSSLSVGTHSITARYGGDATRAPSTSSAVAQVVTLASSSTTIGSNLNPSTYNAPVTLTGTVNSTAATGTITFRDGTTGIGSCTIASGGACTLAIATLSVGSHSLTAVYAGDSNRSGSTSTAISQVVNKATSSTTLTSSTAGSSLFGGSVTFTASVSTGDGVTATGIVSFSDGTTGIGTCPLSGGTCSLTTSSLSAATHTINAAYSGDATHVASSSSVSQSVAKTGSTTTVSSTSSSTLFGQAITLTAVVASSDGSAVTGTISFSDGTTGIGTCSIAAGTTCSSAAISSLAVGTHSITARFGGDTNRTASTSAPITVTVAKTGSTTTVTSSASYSTFGATVTFTASVSASDGGTASGTATVYDGTTGIGTCTLSAGSCPISSSSLSVGIHSITAVYSGDGSRNGSTSAVLSQIIDLRATTTSVVATPATIAFGATTTLAATVTATAGGTPTGVVSFTDGSTALGVCSLTSGGSCSISASGLSVGTHTIGVAYSGDSSRLGSSATATVTVNKATTSTTVSVDRTSATYGTTLLFSAAVTASGATGSFSILDGTTGIGTCPIVAGGSCTLPISTLAVGTHTITASYAGDGSYQASTSSSLTVTIAKTGSTTTVSSTSSSTLFGQAITLTAVVASSDGSAVTGTISFSDGTTGIGTCSIAAGTTCSSAAISSFAVGTHSITARFGGDTNRTASTSAPITVTVAKTGSTTTLSASATSTAYGGSITFTASVTTGDGGTATGTISFSDGTAGIGTCPLSGGSCTLSTATLGVGTHSISASFGGDTNRVASTSAALEVVVAQRSTTTTVAASPATTSYGTTVTLTATVTAAAGGVPAGTVSFTDGSTALGVCSLTSGGSCSISASGLSVGTHTIGAVYSGDASRLASSTTTTVVINKVATTTSVSSSPASSTYGGTVSFSATVSPSSATGTATIYDGGVAIGTCELAGGFCSVPTGALAAGSHTISASYAGDGSHLSSSTATSLPFTVAKANSTTAVAASPAGGSAYGTGVTLSATVATSDGSTAVGTVTFSDGTAFLGSCTLGGGTCALASIATLAVGSHSFSARFNGDTNHNVSTSGSIAYTVSKAGSTTSVSSSLVSSTYGQAVTFSASVATSDGSAAIGTVSISDGATALGTCTLSSGTCSIAAIGSLTVGTHQITARFNGDTNHNASTSAVLAQVVDLAPTTTSVTVSPASPTFGQTVTLTARVAAGVGGTASGSVGFTEDGNTLGTCSLTSGGACSVSTSTLAIGSHAIAIAYGGDTSRAASSTTTSVTVGIAPTTTSVSSSLNPARYGQSVTFTATVAAGVGGTPTGVVSFSDGSSFLGACTLAAGGTCSYSTAVLDLGGHSITATYAGDASRASSTSGVLTQTINQATSTTTVASSAPSTVYGQSVTFTASVSTGDGVTATGTVSFADGTTGIGTCTLSGGTCASPAISTLSAATHTISATYGGDTTHASSTGSTSQVVAKTGASVVVTSSLASTSYGQAVTFTATVSSSDGSAAAGSVSFSDGSTTIGSCTLSLGSCTSAAISSLAAGTHSITARYGGDANRSVATSAAIGLVVAKAGSTTTIGTSNPTIAYGSSVTFTGSVTTGDGSAPTGTITFYDGATALGTACTISGSSCSISTTTLSGGTHSITAVYSGDANRAGSTSSAITQTVTLIATTTALTTSLGGQLSKNYGQSITFTATVSPSAATGTATFYDASTGNSVVGSCTLASGTCSFSTATIPAGSHGVYAVYGGDANRASSTSSSVAFTVAFLSTTTALTASATSTTYGQAVTFTATVTVAGGGVATGRISFSDGTTPVGSCDLSAATCSITTSTLLPGAHSITARYGGDAGRSASTSSAASVTVGYAPTTTTLTSDASATVYGTSVTFTGSVTTGDGGAANGSISFWDGATWLGSCALTGGTGCSFATSTLDAGTHTVTASYSGDAVRSGSTSSGVTVTVAQTGSSAALTTSATTLAYGDSLLISVTITTGDGSAAGGTATIFDGGSVLQACTLTGGTCAVATNTLRVGNHSLLVAWGGDTNRTSSVSAARTVSIVKATPTVVLTVDGSDLTTGIVVATGTGVARVSVAGGTGSITLLDGTTVIGTCELTTGTCDISLATLAAGSYSLVASYAGDANYYAASSLAPISITVADPAPQASPPPATSTSTGDVSSGSSG